MKDYVCKLFHDIDSSRTSVSSKVPSPEMPRPPSSDGYVQTPDLKAQVGALRLEERKELPKVAPLVGKPDYLSITWLASKVNLYGEVGHLSSSGTKATFAVGEGATFAVYRMQDQKRVIKRPLLLFQQNQGEEHVFRQLYSLHLELRVLTDSRIRSHPNIVKLLTVFWEEHPDDMGHYWPSLVLENADLGTLSNYFQRGERPSLDVQRYICHGIGSGLEFLHRHGVVHGDVKCDNVLLFRSNHDKEGIMPKLGDFGYAVLDGQNTPLLGRGTHPYKAPELYDGEIARSDIVYTDIYSFGLLVWQVSQDGTNPFEDPNVCPHPIFSARGREHIQMLKENDRLLGITLSSLTGERIGFRRALELTIKSAPLTRKLKDALQALGSNILDDSAGVSGSADSLSRQASVADVGCFIAIWHLG
jgi:serine/threonine protein kinase